MKTKLFFIIFISVLFCNVAFSQNSDYDLYRVDELESQSAKEYWTTERMANAIPIPLPQVSRLSKVRQQKNDTLPKVEAESLKETFLSSSEVETHEALEPLRVDVNLTPYKQAGKLYFRRDGVDSTCSAQFVGSDSIILTAAHCIKEAGGSWSTDVVFRRGDSNGGGQLTSVSCYGVNDGWNDSKDELTKRKWDYAFGRTLLSSNAGYLGLSTALPYSLKSIGYPRNYDNKRYLYRANGIRGVYSDSIVQMQGNTMGTGASGGAWFQRDSNTVVGLNSFRHSENPSNSWSPNFDFFTISLYHFILDMC